jgi:AcrR family transcriptional regulator
MRTATATLVERALGAAEPEDETTERILDAAVGQFELFGLRRSSVEDVARRAGVSRMTIYRRFPQKDALVEAAILRECRRFFAELERRTAGLPTLEDRLVESFVLALGFALSHPLLERLRVGEPEALLPFLTSQRSPVLTIVREFLVAQIRRGQEEGIVAGFDPIPLAEILGRLALSFVLIRDSRLPVAAGPDGLALAHRYLAPLIAAAIAEPGSA